LKTLPKPALRRLFLLILLDNDARPSRSDNEIVFGRLGDNTLLGAETNRRFTQGDANHYMLIGGGTGVSVLTLQFR